MNTNKLQNEFIFDTNRWHELLDNKKYKIHRVFLNEDDNLQSFLHVFYSLEDDVNQGNDKTNVIVASFVTAHARIKLFREINKLGPKRILYCDTDSMLFVSNKKTNEYIPKLGNNLGDLTSEISESMGNYIQTFVSTGPKNYAFKTDSGYIHCCVKGFTLNHLTSLKLNFESIIKIVTDERNKKEKIKVNQLKFRLSKNFDVKTEIIEKTYGFVYDKRILLGDNTTLPYGFKTQ